MPHEIKCHVGLLEAIYAEYRNGATIVAQFLHERWKPLKRLCQSLAAEFSAEFLLVFST